MSGEETEVGSIVGYLRIDDSDWDAKLDAADAKAKEVGRNNPRITIEIANFAEAIAALQAVKTQEDSVSSSSVKMKASVKDANDSAFRPLLTTALLLGPALAPLAVVGAAAFGGLALGAAGVVLGIKGISTEMARGTAMGVQYQAGLNVLKSDLAQIEQTAARGLLAPFNDSVGILTEAMPQLNTQVGVFASLVASDVPFALDAAVSGLRIFDPLLVKITQDVGGLVQDLDGWVNDGGLQRWANTAQAELPEVEKDIGEIATAVGHLAVAFTSTGTVALSEIGLLARVINAIPVSQLDHVATAVTLMFAAWKGYQVLNLAKDGFDKVSASIGTTVQWLQRSSLATQAQADAASAAGLKTATFAVASDGAATALAGEAVAADAAAVSTRSAAAATEAAEIGMSAALGPIGLVAAGIGLIAYAFMSGSSSTHQATQDITDYTDALKADDGAIADHTRAVAGKNLVDSGAIDNAKKLGISTQDLTDAITGNGDAQQRVQAVIDGATTAWTKADTTSQGATKSQVDAANAAHNLGTELKTQETAFSTSNAAVQQLQATYAALGLSLDGTATAAAQGGIDWQTLNAAQATAKATAQQNATQIAQTTLNMQQENDAAGLLSGALNVLNGKALNVDQAQTQLDQTVLASTKTLKDNKGVIDDHTQAGVDDRQAIEQMKTGLDNVATSVATQTGSTKQATDAYNAQAQQLLDNIKQTDGADSAAYKYAQQLFAIGKIVVPPTQLEIDDAQAKADLTDFQTRINNLHGAALTVTINGQAVPASVVETPGGGHKSIAAGGLVDGPGTGTSDSIAANVSKGEFVVRAAMVERPGVLSFLKALNSGGGSGVAVPGIGSPAAQAVSASYATPTAPSSNAGASGGGAVSLTVYSVLDGQVVATSTNEVNLDNVRRS